jgi:hypothetical protein
VDPKYKYIGNVEHIATIHLKGANNDAMLAWKVELDVYETGMKSVYVGISVR